MRAHSALTSFTADGGSPRGHRVSLHNLGAAAQKVAIHSPADPAAPPTTFSIQTAGWQTSRTAPIWFESRRRQAGISSCTSVPGNGGTQLSVHSPNVDARLDIRMLTRSSDPAANPIAAYRSQVVLPAGQVVRLEPSSWQREALSSTPVRRAVIPAFGSSQVLDITTILEGQAALTRQGLALDIRSGCVRGVVEGAQSGMFLVSDHTGANDEHLLRTP